MTHTPKADVLFPQSTREECLKEIQKNTSLYSRYLSLNDTWQNNFLDFMAGKKTLPLTYDPIFKKLFNPEVYPD